MSFYRTYRPQLISEIDNVSVRDRILSLLTKKKADLPHAYLFTGPRGAGKTTAARLVAKLFNCTKPTKTGEPASTQRGEPCGACEQCTSIAQGTNIDVLEMDAASNRGIDEIRQLRDGIHLAPAAAAYKVYIIDEVHMLTTEAFNALLKTLEEPPTHAVFILATTDPQKIPVTVLSRCMGISFAKAGESEILAALGRIVQAESITIDSDALELIAAHTDGSFRDAVKMLEQASFTKGKISLEEIRLVLSVVDDESLQTFLDAIAQKDIHVSLRFIQSVMEKGHDIKTVMSQVLKKLEGLLLSVAKGNKEAGWSLSDIQSLIELFSRAFSDMKYATIVQLPLEIAVIEYCLHSELAIHSEAQSRHVGELSKTSIPQTVSQPLYPTGVTQLGKNMPEKQAQEPLTHEPVYNNGLITLEKLTEHWKDIIDEVKVHNNSISGVLRSTRPQSAEHGIVVIEAFYPFHKDRLSDVKSKDIIVTALKKLFGERVKVEIVLGKK